MRLERLLPILKEAGIKIASEHPNGGGWVPVFCPLSPYLHEVGSRDRNPSCFVKVGGNNVSAVHCFSCSFHGRLSKLFRLLEYYGEEGLGHLSIRADMEEIPSSFGEWQEDDLIQEQRIEVVEETFLNMYPLAMEDRECRAYLQKRGVGKMASELLGLRYDPEESRVLFPIRGRSGELYGYSGRAIKDTGYSRHRDYGFSKEQCLLGEQLYEKGKPIFIVEGLFAFAHLIEIGARKLVNPMATLGSHLTKGQRDILLDMDETIYLCYDDDAAGTAGLFGSDGKGGAVGMLKEHLPVRVPLYPLGIDDPDFLDLKLLQKMVERDHESY